MSGGLSSILNTTTYKHINYRPFPVDRLNINVGERPIIGIPYLRNTNMKPVDSRISNTARLGQTTSLPDRRLNQKGQGETMEGGEHTPEHMEGGNIIKDVVKGVKKAAKFVKKKKLISKAANLGATVATALGQPEIAAPLASVGQVASTIGLGQEGGQEEEEEEQTLPRGVRGNEKMSFVATHPLNYRRARLATLMRA